MAGRGIRGAMKIMTVSLGIVLSLMIPLAMALLIFLQLDENSDVQVWLAVLGATTLGILPVIAGTVTASWDADPRTPLGRTYYVRLMLIVAAVVVAGATAIVIVTAVGALPVWVAVLAIVSSVLLTGLSMWVGEMVRRRSDSEELAELTPEELSISGARRRWLRIAIAFAVTLVVSLTGGLLVVTLSGYSDSGAIVALGLSLACIVASFVCLSVQRPMLLRVRRLFAGDRALAKRVATVVWKGKQTELTAHETSVAAKYAPLLVGILPFQVAQALFVFLGVGMLRVVNLVSGNEDFFVFDVIFLSLIGIAIVVSVPVSVARFRRVRRYRDAHAIPPLEREPEPDPS